MIKTVRSLVLVVWLASLAQVAYAQALPGSLIVPKAKAPARSVQVVLERMFYDYDLVELPLVALDQQVKAQGRLALFLRNQIYPLELAPNDLRAAGYREVLIAGGASVEHPPGPVVTFAGRVSGDPESVVRVTATRGMFTGYIKTGEEWLFIDPLRDYVPGAPARLAVVYREADVRPEAGGQCGSAHLRQAGRALGFDSRGIKNHNTLRRLDIATESDGEYYQLYGVGGFDRIAAIINGVDGIYRSQINLFLQITFQQLWTDPATDPYTSTDSFTTLAEFKDWWNANRTNVNRDLTHLFSGKDLAGNIIGLAYVAVLCTNPTQSYGLSQDEPSLFIRVELTAHELGHNLSATHDNEEPICPSATCNGSGPIMCSFIQNFGSNTFSSCSKSQIDNHTHNNGFCLN